MSQQTRTRHLEPFLQVADEPWQALFLADDAREDLPAYVLERAEIAGNSVPTSPTSSGPQPDKAPPGRA